MQKTILFVLGVFGIPSFAFGQVVINEIAWMGAPVEGMEERQWWRYEWLELYNPTDVSVPLDGWRVGLYREKLDFEVVLRGTVEARGYFLVGASERMTGVDMSYESRAGKFVNAGQRVVLRNAAGAVAEEFDATGGWFAGDNDTKTTMERRFPERDASDAENWGSSMPTGGTPKAENSVLGKERFAALTAPDPNFSPEQKTRWASFLSGVGNPVFMRAFLVAVLAAVSMLALRRHLLERAEGSFDVLRD